MPWNVSLSAGCLITKLKDFNEITKILENLGFKFTGVDRINVIIKDPKDDK